MTMEQRRPTATLLCCLLGGLLTLGSSGAVVRGVEPPAEPQQPPPAADAQDDIAAKAAILRSPRWRRAIFELGEWLSTQQIYPPKEVVRIKSDFNQRVAKMSASDLEYMLDDLEAKFKVIDTPESLEVRAWVGQYLSAMSDRKRAQALKDVPNVINMSAGELAIEMKKIEQKRLALQRRQADFEEGRQALVQQAEASRQLTVQAAAAATAQLNAAQSFSPYRGGGGSGGGSGGGKQPFADADTGGGMSITSGPFGAYVSMNLGSF